MRGAPKPATIPMSIDPLDPRRTALLIMDVQPGILALYPDATETFLTRLDKLAGAARAAGVKVIYVVVSFRPGHPEISPRNLGFSRVKESDRLVDQRVHARVAPQPGDVVVVKRRVSAFSGSDLKIVLRSHDVQHLILSGIATSGVVLSTLRQAADADYRLTVLADCCLDADAEVHDVLINKIFPRQATVTTADALIGALEASRV